MRQIQKFIASGFGSGLSPVAPGTAGSLAAAIVLWVLNLDTSTIALLFLVSIPLSYWSLLCLQDEDPLDQDPGWVVVDEWQGIAIAWIVAPAETFVEAIALFCAFRIFDILKPDPIGWIDDQHASAHGILVDDWVAGVLAGVVLLLLHPLL